MATRPPEQMSPAPERQQVLSFVTPDKRDLLFWEARDSRKPENQVWEYGDPHWDRSKYTNYELVYVAPADNSGWQKWFYAASRKDQENYNYTISDDRNLVRTFVVKRLAYETGLEDPTDADAFVLPDPRDADDTFTDFEFTHANIRRLENSELDPLFILVEQHYLNDPEDGSGVSSRLGGGVVDITTDLVDDDTPADSGFLILDSRVEPLGNGSAIKTTQTLTGGYPTLIEDVYDPQTEKIIRITKEVVVPGTVSGSFTNGTVVEVQPVDRWRSVSITSTFPSSPNGTTNTYSAVFSYTFPPVLTSVTMERIFAWCMSDYKYAYEEDIAITMDITEARSMSCAGRVIQIFTYTPDSVLSTYPTYNFYPERHVIRRGFTAWYTSADPVIATATARYKEWQLPMALHGGIGITITTHSVGEGLIEGVTIDGERTSFLSATTPAELPTGTWITIDVEVKKGKLGIHECLVKQIQCP